jgi:molybdopterin-biosynthesis enzyme MoeA-like protein
MNFGLIVIGDEILSGKRQDRHLAKAIELLSARGLRLSWARYLGDEREQIAAALRQAFEGGDAVFSCGGIGATPDDHTRQAAAAALAVPLALHPEARELITQRMREMAADKGLAFDPDSADSRQRLHMGEFPQGAQIIPNPYNRIPGFSVGEVHFLPGFPVMAHPMMEWLLDTRYAALHGTQRLCERSFIVMGALEATLTPLMEALEAAHAQVRVFSLPSVDHPQWGRHVELGVKGPATAVDAAFEELRAGLVRLQVRLGPEVVR